ncbi:SurA N-terminal domain-containing protein [bacterium]|nr:SurA N-terminal domain-containing protein [bacterium]
MFTDLRKKSSSIVIAIMFGIIIVTFVISFGPGSQGGLATADKYAATVNGDIITEAEFRYEYNRQYDYYARVFPNFNEKMAREQGLGKNTMDRLVGMLLLAQKADSMGFHVSDVEIAKVIRDNPAFQKEGAFDMELYRRAVQFQINASVKQYEVRVRRELQAQKLINFLGVSTGVSSAEVKDEYINNNEQLKAEFILLSRAALTADAKERIAKSITDAAVTAFLTKDAPKVKAYFDTHGDEFATKATGGATVKKEFAAVKNEIAKKMVVDAAIDALLKSDSQRLLALTKADAPLTNEVLTKEFADWKLELKPLDNIKKSAVYLPGIGMDKPLVEKLFALKTAPAWLPEVVATDAGQLVVVRVVEHPPIDMEKFKTAKFDMDKRMSSRKAGTLLMNYIDELKTKASLEISSTFLSTYTATEEQ